MINSPLRYPGGKGKLARFIATLCEKNNAGGHYVEPYAGGAGVALYLLFNEYVGKATINDIDRSIYAFWHSILNNTEKFCDRIERTEITMENWDRFRKIQDNKEKCPLFDLGFSTFFLNRTNRSGIIDGGMIGGRAQKGEYRMDCRFNKEELIWRIRRIAGYRGRIRLYNIDAMDLVQKIKHEQITEDTIFYFDPPYYTKGPSLYMNHYQKDDHKRVAKEIGRIKRSRWIVSYDDVPEIRDLYRGYDRKKYPLVHTAYNRRSSGEVLFFSHGLKNTKAAPVCGRQS